METDQVLVLETNVDDCTPEIVGAVITDALSKGALDAWATPITMKKSRPGILLSVMVEPSLGDEMSDWLMAQTGSFGVRSCTCRRRKLLREIIKVQTQYGEVEVKIGRDGERVIVLSPEYESCRKVAAEKKIPVRLVYTAALMAGQDAESR